MAQWTPSLDAKGRIIPWELGAPGIWWNDHDCAFEGTYPKLLPFPQPVSGSIMYDLPYPYACYGDRRIQNVVDLEGKDPEPDLPFDDAPLGDPNMDDKDDDEQEGAIQSLDMDMDDEEDESIRSLEQQRAQVQTHFFRDTCMKLSSLFATYQHGKMRRSDLDPRSISWPWVLALCIELHAHEPNTVRILSLVKQFDPKRHSLKMRIVTPERDPEDTSKTPIQPVRQEAYGSIVYAVLCCLDYLCSGRTLHPGEVYDMLVGLGDLRPLYPEDHPKRPLGAVHEDRMIKWGLWAIRFGWTKIVRRTPLKRFQVIRGLRLAIRNHHANLADALLDHHEQRGGAFNALEMNWVLDEWHMWIRGSCVPVLSVLSRRQVPLERASNDGRWFFHAAMKANRLALLASCPRGWIDSMIENGGVLAGIYGFRLGPEDPSNLVPLIEYIRDLPPEPRQRMLDLWASVIARTIGFELTQLYGAAQPYPNIESQWGQINQTMVSLVPDWADRVDVPKRIQQP